MKRTGGVFVHYFFYGARSLGKPGSLSFRRLLKEIPQEIPSLDFPAHSDSARSQINKDFFPGHSSPGQTFAVDVFIPYA